MTEFHIDRIVVNTYWISGNIHYIRLNKNRIRQNPLWLWNPEETSPEIQNRVPVAPKIGHMYCMCPPRTFKKNNSGTYCKRATRGQKQYKQEVKDWSDLSIYQLCYHMGSAPNPLLITWLFGADSLSGGDQEWIPSLFWASDWLRQITWEWIPSYLICLSKSDGICCWSAPETSKFLTFDSNSTSELRTQMC